MHLDFITVIKYAWMAYDSTRTIKVITDISARVSTNHVFKVVFEDRSSVIAKLTYFGSYEHFVEDHTIINVLANNLPQPFENFLARSLIKGNSLFVHRFQNDAVDIWVVFYRPIRIRQKLPKRLEVKHIEKMAEQFAHFHRACYRIRTTLPKSSKTLEWDVRELEEITHSEMGRYEHRMNLDEIRKQCAIFTENIDKLEYRKFDKIPVFVDWNIGNFSVTASGRFFSRWDYDWFRISSRVLDFYFISRIVSDIGDQTIFSYTVDQLTEERFLHFLKVYHQIYPLTEPEILFMKEAYRFFILHYVVKFGRYFFLDYYATRLQKEAFDLYFPTLESNFDPEKILKALNM